MGFVYQSLAILFAQTCGDEQYGRCSTEGSGIELCLVDDEVLIEDGQRDTTLTSLTDIIIAATKILFVCKYAESSCTILLI